MTTTTQLPAARFAVRSAVAVPAVVGVFAALLSLIAITVPSIWYDEAATISSASRSWPQLWSEIHTVDAVHALYYAFMHVVFDAIGYSPFTLRLPSAIASGIGAAFTVVLGRQLGRKSFGLIGGIVFAVLPRVTWAGSEGRSYALTAALAVILTVVFVYATRSPRRRVWVLYGALVALACTVFVYLALVVVAHGVAVAILGTRRRRWVVATASAAVLLTPLVSLMAGQTRQIGWLPTVGVDTWWGVFVEQWFMEDWPFAVVAWLLIIVGGFTVWRSRRADARAVVLLSLFALPTIALVTASVAAFPVYTPRYLTMSLPFVALLMAAAIDAVPRRRSRLVALAAVIAIAVPSFVSNRLPESKEGAAWRAVAELITTQKSPGSAIVFGTVQKHPTATARVIEYAYPAAFADTVDVTIDTSAAASGRLWETTMPLANSLGRLIDAPDVFLVTSKSRDLRPATSATLAGAGWHPVAQWSLAKVNVVKYER